MSRVEKRGRGGAEEQGRKTLFLTFYFLPWGSDE